MRLEQAKEAVNTILNTHVEMVDGANVEVFQNARQDLLLLVEEIVKECQYGVNLDVALNDAEEITREGR